MVVLHFILNMKGGNRVKKYISDLPQGKAFRASEKLPPSHEYTFLSSAITAEMCLTERVYR